MSEHAEPTRDERQRDRTARKARRSVAGKRRGSNHRHTVAKVITAALVTLGVATAIGVVSVYNQLNGNIDVVKVDNQLEDRPPKGPEGPLNVLVMGSDSRAGDNNIDGLTGDGARSDTTILLHLSADRERAYGVSIPRDTLVDRPTCYEEDGTEIPGGQDVMWNEAFALGGPACTIQQFEQISDIRIDQYVVVDFQGFKDMVDAVGGVEVCIPEDIEDPEHDIHLEAGTREIKGDEALSYVRVRAVGNGTDPNRIKRQQAFMAAMMNKVVSGGTLSRPDRVVSFLNAATSSLQTDVESIGELGALGGEFQGVGLGNIKFVTTPWVYSTAQPGRVEWTPDVTKLWRLIREDVPLTQRFAEQSISAADDPDGSDEPGDGAGASSSDSPSTPDESETASPSDGAGQGDGSPSGSTGGLSDEERAAAGLCT